MDIREVAPSLGELLGIYTDSTENKNSQPSPKLPKLEREVDKKAVQAYRSSLLVKSSLVENYKIFSAYQSIIRGAKDNVSKKNLIYGIIKATFIDTSGQDFDLTIEVKRKPNY